MGTVEAIDGDRNWPRLRVDDWIDTRETVHLWTQILGKIRMALTPMQNHWWHVTLYVTPRGLTTAKIPYGRGAFDVEFDFCDHQLRIRSSDGTVGRIVLEAKSVAQFHAEIFETLGRLGIHASIRAVPNEVDLAIPFAEDHQHRSYNPAAVRLFWQQPLRADRVLIHFSSHFRGKGRPRAHLLARTARALKWIRTVGGCSPALIWSPGVGLCLVEDHLDPRGSHVDAIPGVEVSVPPSGTGCVECLASDGWWLHLRRCAQCGHIGCCDTSPAQHATAHARSTGHPVICSFEPGEKWFFHYPSSSFMDGPDLEPPAHHPPDQSVPGPASRVPRDWQRYLH